MAVVVTPVGDCNLEWGRRASLRVTRRRSFDVNVIKNLSWTALRFP